MKFQIDHDYHLHSRLSRCSRDEEQTPEALLRYAERNGFSEICLTDHFWDERVPGASAWYSTQDYPHISQSLPLPKSDSIRFRFGCEIDMDKHMTVGISDRLLDTFSFIIIPTTHLHMTGFTIDEHLTSVEERAAVYVERLDKLLDKDLPFEKIGIAHLTTGLIAYNRKTDFGEHIRIIDAISDQTYEELFRKVLKRGAGVELNFHPAKYTEEELPHILRPYRIAKSVGCKFYLGSDAHHPSELEMAPIRFEAMVNHLDLQESDRFHPKD